MVYLGCSRKIGRAASPVIVHKGDDSNERNETTTTKPLTAAEGLSRIEFKKRAILISVLFKNKYWSSSSYWIAKIDSPLRFSWLMLSFYLNLFKCYFATLDLSWILDEMLGSYTNFSPTHLKSRQINYSWWGKRE